MLDDEKYIENALLVIDMREARFLPLSTDCSSTSFRS